MAEDVFPRLVRIVEKQPPRPGDGGVVDPRLLRTGIGGVAGDARRVVVGRKVAVALLEHQPAEVSAVTLEETDVAFPPRLAGKLALGHRFEPEAGRG